MNAFQKLAMLLDRDILNAALLGGGCTSKAYCVTLSDASKIFVKAESPGPQAFAKESRSLAELANSGMATPKVLYVDDDFLALEFIEPAKNSTKTAKDFGVALAKLHQCTASKFGFIEDNFIGDNIQKNTPKCNNWSQFYFENRLLAQLRLAEKRGTATAELGSKIAALEIIVPKILDASIEPPSLLHGDLWSGNYLTSVTGKTYLIDPAVYYGHREAELALCRLFGGFDPAFYLSYNANFPLAEGWQHREKIYQLYHLLNHLNMLGSSYYGQVIAALNYYLV